MYIDRMEAHLETDFSTTIENAKALLESIGKEICEAKGVQLGSTPSINVVLKKAFIGLGYTADDLVSQVSGSLATIGQLVGNLRNEISPTSHGKSLEELKERNNKIDLLTKEFLIDSTLVVAVFLIRAFEERSETASLMAAFEADGIPEYDDNEDFNDFWDENFGEFAMGSYSYPASEILYNVDSQAYQTEYKIFNESKEELTEGDA